ncbi:MAG: glycosyltransferase [Phycisphaerae bacterium]
MAVVSVLLPVHAAVSPREAMACLRAQTLEDLEIIVLANGVGDEAFGSLAALAREDGRVRLERLERPGLPAALNHGLRAARANLVARMDADDRCAPERLAVQAAAAERRAELAAIGCGFEVVTASGELLAIERPPVDEREAAWRLLVGNPFAHGSMLLRRDAAIEAGGYDERLTRAQDYDLWLRLAGRVAAVPDVLYRYVAHAGEGYSSSVEQASFAAEVMAAAWSRLPRGDASELAPLLAGALGTRAAAAASMSQLEAWMTRRGATCESLMAWMTCRHALGGGGAGRDRRGAIEAAVKRLLARGVEGVHVWGAGAHTAVALEALERLGLEVKGIVDDALGGQVHHGRRIEHPHSLPPGAEVLISSDRHERAIWEASEGARRRGVRVHRIYDT